MRKNKLRAGIIGCGAIGSEIALQCRARLGAKLELVGICDVDRARAEALRSRLGGRVRICGRSQLIRKSRLVIEAASAGVSGDIVDECLRQKRDVMVMSVGGLLGRPGLLAAIRRSSSRVYLPSGAICGIDGVKGAAVKGIRRVRITTRKSPRSLKGAPYLVRKGIDPDSIREETVVFRGSAREAVAAFPQNINVSATLCLASEVGEENVEVTIVASPAYTRNVHEIEVEGDFGRMVTRTENVPSDTNPKTSMLAMLSAVAMLEGIVGNLKVGT